MKNETITKNMISALLGEEITKIKINETKELYREYKEVQELVEKNEEIKEATIEVEKMSEDEKMQRLAFLREKAILDEKDIYRAGIDKGEKNGRKEEKIEIAKEMLKKGIDTDLISEITKLTKEEIEKIVKK